MTEHYGNHDRADDATGHVDVATALMVTGWAAIGDKPCPVRINVNGKHRLDLEGGHYRSDLKELGLPPLAGFEALFDPPLEEGSAIEILMLGHKHAAGSPLVLGTRDTVSADEDTACQSPIIFLHIPKTGGTSVRRVFDIVGHQTSLYKNELNDPEFIKRFRQAVKPRFIIGHTSYGAHQALKIEPRYTTVLRDPVERLISLYKYMHHLPQDRFRRFRNMSFEQWIRSGLVEDTNNHMCRIIAGTAVDQGPIIKERWLLELAEHNLRKHFEVVGTTDDLGGFCRQLGRLLGEKVDGSYRENVGRGEDITLDTSALKAIYEFNALDIALYNNFVRKRQQCESKISVL